MSAHKLGRLLGASLMLIALAAVVGDVAGLPLLGDSIGTLEFEWH